MEIVTDGEEPAEMIQVGGYWDGQPGEAGGGVEGGQMRVAGIGVGGLCTA